MQTLKLILKWVYGVSFILFGFQHLVSNSFIGGLCFIVSGLVMMPPTLKLIETKLGNPLSRATKYIIVFVAFIIGCSTAGNKQAEIAKQNRKTADSIAQVAAQAKKAAYDKLPQHVKDSLAKVQAKQDSLDNVQREIDQLAKQAQARQESIKSQFSAYDGSHYRVSSYIEKNMNDPDSYEHIETRYIDKGNHLIIVTKYRGKNRFGAKVINTATAKVDLEGNILEFANQ